MHALGGVALAMMVAVDVEVEPYTVAAIEQPTAPNPITFRFGRDQDGAVQRFRRHQLFPEHSTGRHHQYRYHPHTPEIGEG